VGEHRVFARHRRAAFDWNRGPGGSSAKTGMDFWLKSTENVLLANEKLRLGADDTGIRDVRSLKHFHNEKHLMKCRCLRYSMRVNLLPCYNASRKMNSRMMMTFDHERSPRGRLETAILARLPEPTILILIGS
jgi:hypothetical protein